MKLSYSKETEHHYQDWVNKGLAIGNGFLGAKIYGSAKHEIVQINEKSLWTGGPTKDAQENIGGNERDVSKQLKTVQKALADNQTEKAAKYAETYLVGRQTREYGSYIPLLDYEFCFEDHELIENYRRELDLEQALVRIQYDINKQSFERTYFASYPDNVIVMRFKALGNKRLNFTCRAINNQTKIHDVMSDQTDSEMSSEIKTVDFTFEKSMYHAFLGEVLDNQRYFSGALKINELDGSLTVKDNLLIFKAVTDVTLIFHAQTDFEQVYPLYRQSKAAVDEKLKKHWHALSVSYETLFKRHLKDYQAIFQRVSFHLEGAKTQGDTSTMLSAYQNNEINLYLEMLLFQYGRYLMISSSRSGENALPANLQGIWNAAINPAWNSDYHLNINLQMNYWPIFNTNMAELYEPLLTYVENLATAGQIAAQRYTGIDKQGAWLVHTQNTPYGWTCPGWDYYWGWSPASNAWIMKNIYDAYRFTQDKDFLNTRIFPLIEKTVAFWTAYLVYDEKSDRFVSSPSYSPEHGPISEGNTYDQSLVYELYKIYLESVEHVKQYDRSLFDQVSLQIKKLKPLHIGGDGQIKEWYEEDQLNRYKNGQVMDKTDPHHRHVSELVGLYPGTLFDDEAYKKAAKVSLNLRGDGGTGWSKANKINLWARLQDGERAYKLLQEQIQNNILENLWNTHPPFQLDGNSGLTSGITEMLLQSYNGTIILLPACPKAWQTGYIEGLVAENNVICDIYWSKGQLEYTLLKSTQKHQQKLSKFGLNDCIISPQAAVQVQAQYYILDFSLSDTFEIKFKS